MSTITPLPPRWDQEVDLLVFGAGTAGMTTALMAKHHGLDVLLCEKTAVVGGISATSGGTTWVPGTTQSQRAGVPDSEADAATFLKAVVGERGGEALREAFLASGPQAIDELERISEVKFVAAAAHPDYVSGPGAAFGGRALAPLAFDARLLGKDFARVRPPRPEFMGLGGMMVPRADLDAAAQHHQRRHRRDDRAQSGIGARAGPSGRTQASALCTRSASSPSQTTTDLTVEVLPEGRALMA